MTEERLHFGNVSDLEIFRCQFSHKLRCHSEVSESRCWLFVRSKFRSTRGKTAVITLVQYLSKSTALKSQEVKECYSTKVSY